MVIDAHTEVGVGVQAKVTRVAALGKLTGGVQVGGCGLVVCEPDADGRISRGGGVDSSLVRGHLARKS